jgi:hypothetical protein
MLRKSLILGSMTLLLVMLFAFTGCEGPVGPAGPAGGDGTDGRSGQDGGMGNPGGYGVGGTEIKDTELKAIFEDRGNVVIVESSVLSISGEVPEGKTLIVIGGETAVSGQLTVKGTLELKDAASMLDARGITGKVVIEGGAVTGNGALLVPYVLDGGFFDGAHYASPELASVVVYPGSVVNRLGLVEKISSAGIRAIFGVQDELTVWSIENLGTSAIPAGKSLTLKGANTTSSLSVNAGASLTIEAGAKLEVSGTLLANGSSSLITNKGTVSLLGNASAAKSDSGEFINSGIIESGTVSGSGIANLLGLEGTGGIIKLNAELLKNESFTLTGSLVLKQDLVIAPVIQNASSGFTYTVRFPSVENPFNDDDSVSGKTVTLDNSAARIFLPAAVTEINVPIINKGVIVTETTDDKALKTIITAMNSDGIIDAQGAITDLTQDLEVPEKVELRLTGLSTLDSSSSSTSVITVDGILYLGTNTEVDPLGDITVSQTGTLAFGGSTTLLKVDNTTTMAIDGVLDLGYETGMRIWVSDTATLSISSVGVLGKTLKPGGEQVDVVGGFFVAGGGKLTIDGETGYGVRTDWLRGMDFEEALRDIHLGAETLNKTITLPIDVNLPFYGASPAAPVDVLGTVHIGGPYDDNVPSINGMYYVNSVPNADLSPINYVYLPSGVEIYTFSGGKYLDVVNSSQTAVTGSADLGTPDEYRLASDFAGTVKVGQATTQNGGFNPLGSDKWGFVVFEGVCLAKSNLVGPAYSSTSSAASGHWVNPIIIGIRTKKS